MKVEHKEPASDILELMHKMNYFTKLKPDSSTNNWFNVPIKVTSYQEINLMVSSLLKTSISLLKNDNSETRIDAMILLEIALQLLPNDEMELLDELHRIY